MWCAHFTGLLLQGEKGGGLFMDQCATNVANSTFESNSATLLGAHLATLPCTKYEIISLR
jgi:hypothetical protein